MISEVWNIEYDPNTKQYSIDFGTHFSIIRTELDTILSFINWRLEKIRDNNQTDSAIQDFKKKYLNLLEHQNG
jgi:hypothetical protein